MSSAALTPNLRAAALALGQGVGVILTGLIAVIARGLLRNPLRVAIVLPLCTYLTRAGRRFNRAMERLATGTPFPAARAGSHRGGPAPAPLPSRHGWLLADLRHEAGHFHQRLATFLAQPDCAALLAACPQAARILRPICHILGLPPGALPQRPRPPRQRRPMPARPPVEPSVLQPRPAAQIPAWRHPELLPGAGPPPCPHVGWPWFAHPAFRDF